ncbi:DNA-3-methyladenine glycosylase I [Devosia rhodophyticola]|uniref:DNA-3-methyladenine glycosylase I n=1 Tax=Devosia rhodophyticola TaxID=3026423 RepID=A0ABY7YZ53_9HYPH|nr:DNA-3-methyladenine glycosylase I [Devosia rhodophyticola]WDR06629.1 DNA-3-methyladenine glycosylase I [Devosia rhodophyticola]
MPTAPISLTNDQKPRCVWPGADAFYLEYHDIEWGRPVTDDTRLFEKICLEGFQAGLSWITILRKRERFREVFYGFDIPRVAAMTDVDVDRLLADPGIIRHRGKILATINNAARALEIQAEFGSLAAYFWSFEPKSEARPQTISHADVLAMPHTEASRALSKDLRKRGFKFVGPTTCYAFMQAMGLVNDHIEGCFCRHEVEWERGQLRRPVK